MKLQPRATPRLTARLAATTHPLCALTDEAIEEQVKDNPRKVMARILRNQRDLAVMLANLARAV